MVAEEAAVVAVAVAVAVAEGGEEEAETAAVAVAKIGRNARDFCSSISLYVTKALKRFRRYLTATRLQPLAGKFIVDLAIIIRNKEHTFNPSRSWRRIGQ